MTMSYDEAKRKAGHAAIENHVTRNGMKVGVGSGSTIVFSVERLAEKIENGELKDIITVCTSYQSTLLCQEKGITVTSLDDPIIDGKLDVAIDGADEFDNDLNLIKGGGGAHTQEKIIDSTASSFIVVVDERKKSRFLGEKWAVPIELIPAALNPVLKSLKSMGSEPVLRMAKSKMGPVITDNGNFIIDANFGIIKEPDKLESALNNIPGVVENGIFSGMATVVYMGKSDGTIETFKKP